MDIEDERHQAYPTLRDSQKAKIRRGLLERARRGEATCAAPLGYRNVWQGSRKLVVVDEAVAPLIRAAFRLAADRTPLRSILSQMEAKGLRSRHGKPLGVSSLHKLLANPFYCGYVRFGRELHPGNHERLVPDEVFDAAQPDNRKARSRAT